MAISSLLIRLHIVGKHYICSSHTSYDAFVRGFNIVVAEDGVLVLVLLRFPNFFIQIWSILSNYVM
jgi:hypothetical protein